MISSEFDLKLVDKPWGFEFELYDDKSISIWCVSIGKEHKSGYLLDTFSTSFHMHTSKTAKILVLDGAVNLFHNGDSTILNRSNTHTLPPRTPHKLNAFHGNTILLEIEFPSNRSDIIRLSDSYGRSKNEYSWDTLNSSEVKNWKSELRNRDRKYQIQVTGKSESPTMNLSNGAKVEFVNTNLEKVLCLPENNILIVTMGSIINPLGKSVTLVGDIFDQKYREIFLNFQSIRKYYKNELSGFLISYS